MSTISLKTFLFFEQGSAQVLGMSQSLLPVYQSSLVLIPTQKYPPTVKCTCISFHLKSAPTSPLVSRNYRPDRSETAAWLLLRALRALGLIAPCRWSLEGKGWPAQERTGDWGKYAGTTGTFEDSPFACIFMIIAVHTVSAHAVCLTALAFFHFSGCYCYCRCC